MDNNNIITPMQQFLKKIDSIYNIDKYLHQYKETPQFNYKLQNINNLQSILLEIIDYHFKENTEFTNDISKNRDKIYYYVEILLNKLYQNHFIKINQNKINNVAKLIDLIFVDLKNFYKEVNNAIKYNIEKSKKNKNSTPKIVLMAISENLSKNMSYVLFLLFYNTNIIKSKILINKILTILNINYKNYHLIVNKCQNIIDKTLLNNYVVCNFIRNKEIDKILNSLVTPDSPKSKKFFSSPSKSSPSKSSPSKSSPSKSKKSLLSPSKLIPFGKSKDFPLTINDGLSVIVHIINTLQGLSDKNDNNIINEYFENKEQLEKLSNNIEFEKENSDYFSINNFFTLNKDRVDFSKTIQYPK